jgi:transcriptional regulator with PAS, ATPase and Fis domain
MDIAERQAIESALAAVGGNRRAAAERLGISLRTLFYKIDRLHLE